MTDLQTLGLEALREREARRFVDAHPASRTLAEQSAAHFLYGVPLHWMHDWATPLPLFVREAHGAHFTCADGHDYADFCLGDSGALFGHSPAPVARAIAAQAGRGLTAMLPSTDTAEVGRLLAERFGLPCWQLATTASDANRFMLRWARAVTGRRHILVFDGCYHGTVDDTLVDRVDATSQAPSAVQARASLLGQAHDPAWYTRVAEFNDLAAVEAALADRLVACVLTEPALTNIGMVPPAPGFLEGLRELTRRYGSLLIMDETHTLSSGPGGACRAWGIEPDALVVGKAIAGGLPCAAYGFSAQLATRMRIVKDAAPAGHSGIGTTLSGNPLTLAALRANLAEVMSEAAYAHMLALAEQLATGLETILRQHRLDWRVTRLGARAELQFCAQTPRSGREAAAAFQPALERLLHLYLINRGVLITPFHNMTLVCPATRSEDVQRLLAGVDDCLGEVLAA
jgi:glutamate-1-semialdehyde 2,1-aminomutase